MCPRLGIEPALLVHRLLVHVWFLHSLAHYHLHLYEHNLATKKSKKMLSYCSCERWSCLVYTEVKIWV